MHWHSVLPNPAPPPASSPHLSQGHASVQWWLTVIGLPVSCSNDVKRLFMCCCVYACSEGSLCRKPGLQMVEPIRSRSKWDIVKSPGALSSDGFHTGLTEWVGCALGVNFCKGPSLTSSPTSCLIICTLPCIRSCRDDSLSLSDITSGALTRHCISGTSHCVFQPPRLWAAKVSLPQKDLASEARWPAICTSSLTEFLFESFHSLLMGCLSFV